MRFAQPDHAANTSRRRSVEHLLSRNLVFDPKAQKRVRHGAVSPSAPLPSLHEGGFVLTVHMAGHFRFLTRPIALVAARPLCPSAPPCIRTQDRRSDNDPIARVLDRQSGLLGSQRLKGRDEL
jgi:hypothetical protein